ncbi:sodium/proline symporter PutP [Acetobacter aceti NRIC 0242]|uniref:Cation acetate symporter n=1 Tax=Acetobacter aceti NBRC 14818 TaxID=887700 RepID=A0AB33ICV9_ACEAC|nr:cation/acetate symporter ActP [Acetobacter aceti]TCS25626.1 cation/acetate symporter [Acetobacter aceti NBRC 14818]BCK75831.1 cation acetate symporter [Acetobacter aceti NBRC 14818]GAN58016.1 solute:sodium symporter [Acetobacter aceti NBRC 14818]GBO81889.1 sodium/proline symporter PutP [Acetobacter aceti NRIC 0242]
MNIESLCFCILFVLITGIITYVSARQTKDTQSFYTGGKRITSFQNGMAIAGDAMSAGAFLGLTGLVYNKGYDGVVYAIGYATGMPLVLFLFAEKIRRLGKYTFSDVVHAKLGGSAVRIFGGLATLVIVLFYLTAQLAGAGQLVGLFFGLNYYDSVIIMTILMVVYVNFGGMQATTWVQIIKAGTMLFAGSLMTFLVFHIFDFKISSLLHAAVAQREAGTALLAPLTLPNSPASSISLGITLMAGTAGLPHVLMKFFTVSDVRKARWSVFWATGLMSYFYVITGILGFGAMAILSHNPRYLDAHGTIMGGGNMVALHLAHAVGGDILLGFVSAVAFATVLAVVSGLTLSGAAAVSHDLYGAVRAGTGNGRSEFLLSRIATIVIGVVAMCLAFMFRNQNVAYMISLAFSIACSSTFPVLFLSIYWKKLTVAGAVWGGSSGLMTAVAMTIMGPSVWVSVFGYKEPLITLDPPTLVSMTVAFVVSTLVSLAFKPRIVEATSENAVLQVM